MRFLTVKQLAKELQLGESTVYRLAKSGEIPSYRFGGAYRFELDAVLEAVRQEPVDIFARSYVGPRRRVAR